MSTRKMRNLYAAYKEDLAVAVEKVEEKHAHLLKVADKASNEVIKQLETAHEAIVAEHVKLIDSQRVKVAYYVSLCELAGIDTSSGPEGMVDLSQMAHEDEMVVLRHEYQTMADERVAIIETQRVQIDELIGMLTPLQIERWNDLSLESEPG